MDTNKTGIQTGIHYGAFYGLAAFAFSLLLNFTIGNPLGPLSWWLGVWLPILFISIAIKKHRDEISGGYISFKNAFVAGFYTIACGGILFAVLIYLYGTIIAPQFIVDYKSDMLSKIEEMRQLHLFDESFINSMNKEMEKTTMSSLSIGNYINKVLGGAFISLIAAAVLKRTKQVNDFTTNNFNSES